MTLVATVILMSSLALSSVHAQTAYVHQNVYTSPVYIQYTQLSAGQSVIWHTYNLSSSSADTVLHLYDTGTGAEVAFSDDFSGAPWSLLSYQNTTGSTRYYYLVLRAKGNGSAGYADLYKDFNLIASGVPFGGTFISVPSGTGNRYETSFGPQPNAVEYSALYGLNSTGHLVSGALGGFFNGVGGAARIQGSGIQTAVVSFNPYFTPPTFGVVDFYVNDYVFDTDGDGLGAGLENALGTCETGGPHCANVFNSKDSDHDGIDDGVEVFGYEYYTTYPYQKYEYMRRWDANPLHKDIFVEVDYIQATNPFSQLTTAQLSAWLSVVTGAYSVGPAADLNNPDGIDGLSVHIDLGVTAPSGFSTVAGNWGGTGQCTLDRDSCYTENFIHSQRKPYFRYGHALSSGGQTTGNKSIFDFHSQNPYTFTHELGHAMGLQHWGHNLVDAFVHPTDGKVHAVNGHNCKPNYNSIMNYTTPSLAFSTVARDMAPELNSASLSEVNAFNFPGYTPPDLMTLPHEYEQQNSGRDVDWDRNGSFSSDARRITVRDAGFSGQDCWTYFGEDKFTRTLSTDKIYSGNPEFVTSPGNWLYVFWIEGGKLYYQVGNTQGTASGSCPLGDTPDTDCLTWSARTQVSTVSGLADFAAAEWGGSLWIVYRYLGGGSMYLRKGTISPTTGLLTIGSSSSMGVSEHGPELVQYNVDATVHSSRKLLALLFTSNTNNDYLFRTTPDPALGLSSWSATAQVKTSTNAVVTGERAPSGVAWPSTNPGIFYNSKSTTCATFTDYVPVGQQFYEYIHFMCLDRNDSQLRWVELPSSLFPYPMRTVGDINLTYNYYRKSNGQVIDPLFLSGRFFLTYDNGFAASYFTSSEFNILTTPTGGNWLFIQDGYLKNFWTDTIGDSAAIVYDHILLGAPKGAHFQTNKLGIDELYFHPLADGTYNFGLHSESDFRIMADAGCRITRGETFCGTFSQTQWGY